MTLGPQPERTPPGRDLTGLPDGSVGGGTHLLSPYAMVRTFRWPRQLVLLLTLCWLLAWGGSAAAAAAQGSEASTSAIPTVAVLTEQFERLHHAAMEASRLPPGAAEHWANAQHGVKQLDGVLRWLTETKRQATETLRVFRTKGLSPNAVRKLGNIARQRQKRIASFVVLPSLAELMPQMPQRGLVEHLDVLAGGLAAVARRLPTADSRYEAHKMAKLAHDSASMARNLVPVVGSTWEVLERVTWEANHLLVTHVRDDVARLAAGEAPVGDDHRSAGLRLPAEMLKPEASQAPQQPPRPRLADTQARPGRALARLTGKLRRIFNPRGDTQRDHISLGSR